eukprot:3219178-Rhodomonas_salina.1
MAAALPEIDADLGRRRGGTCAAAGCSAGSALLVELLEVLFEHAHDFLLRWVQREEAECPLFSEGG